MMNPMMPGAPMGGQPMGQMCPHCGQPMPMPDSGMGAPNMPVPGGEEQVDPMLLQMLLSGGMPGGMPGGGGMPPY